MLHTTYRIKNMDLKKTYESINYPGEYFEIVGWEGSSKHDPKPKHHNEKTKILTP